MTRLAGVLRDAAAILAKAEARWALVGGLAVSARTEPRFTRDADIAVSVGSDTEAEDLVRRFGQAGYGIKAVVEQEAQDRLATARLLPPGEPEEGLVLDLLFASSGIEPELVAAVADRIGQTLVDYYRAMLAIDGVCAVLQGDDMGHRGGLLISREHLEQYAVPWHKRLAEMVHARGLPYCLHSCGQVEEIMSPMIDEVGIDAKHSFEDVIVPAADF